MAGEAVGCERGCRGGAPAGAVVLVDPDPVSAPAEEAWENGAAGDLRDFVFDRDPMAAAAATADTVQGDGGGGGTA